jgi:hypothetical protein
MRRREFAPVKFQENADAVGAIATCLKQPGLALHATG